MHIGVKKGLDIPIGGKPEGAIQKGKRPPQVALNLSCFSDTKFKLYSKVGDHVKLGQPLLHDKGCEERVFVAPAAGTIQEIRRGSKRHITDIVIAVDTEEHLEEHPTLDPKTASSEELLRALSMGGLLPSIRQRPFNLFADPSKAPRNIFVKAIESAPFTPEAEMQVEGHEEDFQTGLEALQKLTLGKVHLVYKKGSPLFPKFKGVEHHTVSGPHPAGNVSLHIHHIDPITHAEDVLWTISALDVVAIGHLLKTGHCYTERVVSIAGPGIVEGRGGFVRARAGYPIELLIENRIDKRPPPRLISGDPLMGTKVEQNDFLGFYDTTFCAIPENHTREFLHFFRLGVNKYSYSRAYLSGFLDNTHRIYPFTTSKHGEHRAFVEGGLYDKVTPLDISTMPLVKAVMAEDFDLAETLGLLEVDGEDFALATFVCPSKMEMTDIIQAGLKQHATELLD